jgi:excisionase family DNA binding protein
VPTDGPHRKRDETAAIFARIPRAEAEKLDRLSFELKRPKQEILAGLVARYGEGEREASGPATEPWSLGRIALPDIETPEVLTLEQLAQFLQVSVEEARALAESGDVRGRRIGEHWRFSRKGVLDWLEEEKR